VAIAQGFGGAHAELHSEGLRRFGGGRVQVKGGLFEGGVGGAGGGGDEKGGEKNAGRGNAGYSWR